MRFIKQSGNSLLYAVFTSDSDICMYSWEGHDDKLWIFTGGSLNIKFESRIFKIRNDNGLCSVVFRNSSSIIIEY